MRKINNSCFVVNDLYFIYVHIAHLNVAQSTLSHNISIFLLKL